MALYAVREALAPPAGEQEEAIVIALGRQIGLMRPNLAVEQKEEWIGIVMGDLVDQPASLVLDALPAVRKRCRFEGEVLPSLLEEIETRATRLRIEMRNLERLEQLAA